MKKQLQMKREFQHFAKILGLFDTSSKLVSFKVALSLEVNWFPSKCLLSNHPRASRFLRVDPPDTECEGSEVPPVVRVGPDGFTSEPQD